MAKVTQIFYHAPDFLSSNIGQKRKEWERKRTCDPEYTALNEKIIEMEEHFQNLLSPEEYAKLGEMQSLRAQTAIIENTDLFEYSFCLGALMMIDIFSFKGND